MHENYRPLVEDKYKNDELYKKPSQEVYDAYYGDKAVRADRKKLWRKMHKYLKVKKNLRNEINSLSIIKTNIKTLAVHPLM